MFDDQDAAAEIEAPLRMIDIQKEHLAGSKQERRPLFGSGKGPAAVDKADYPGAESHPEALQKREHLESAIEVKA